MTYIRTRKRGSKIKLDEEDLATLVEYIELLAKIDAETPPK